MNGVLFINKPKGFTSRDIVNKVSYIFKTKKVGHTGTLDPLATGVLIICLGNYTKLVNHFTISEKEYIATMKLGLLTDTLDIEGKIIKKENINIKEEKIKKVFQEFPKEYIQTVPIYSAVKINGRKLYEYARQNIAVELPKRKVFIKSLEILKIQDDEITLKTTVSKGTYIRSLINDLAKNINTVATMTSLIRTKQGDISLKNCYELEKLSSDTPLKKIDDLFSYPHYEITKKEKNKVLNGNILKLASDSKFLILTYHQKVLALYEKENDHYKIILKENN